MSLGKKERKGCPCSVVASRSLSHSVYTDLSPFVGQRRTVGDEEGASGGRLVEQEPDRRGREPERRVPPDETILNTHENNDRG